MIKVENIEVWGFEHAIRGMRNPLNSWDRSDSYHAVDCGKCGRIEREGHKLDEWREFCKILKQLPYVEVIRDGR